MYRPLGIYDETLHTVQRLHQVHAFLSEEQYEGMMKYSTAILHAIADAVALVRVTEFKESLELSEDQVTALTLVVSDDLRRLVETFQDYGDRDLGQAPIYPAGVNPQEYINQSVDPLPQALVLTSIVIGLGVVAVMVSLAVRLYDKYGTFDITKIRKLRG